MEQILEFQPTAHVDHLKSTLTKHLQYRDGWVEDLAAEQGLAMLAPWDLNPGIAGVPGRCHRVEHGNESPADCLLLLDLPTHPPLLDSGFGDE